MPTNEQATTKHQIAIMLAAGAARRFGGDKRLAQLASGKTILQQSLSNALPHYDKLYLVIRPAELAQLKLDPTLTAKLQIVEAADAEAGMGHSLAAGAKACLNAIPHSISILLADMPWIKHRSFEILLDSAHKLAQDEILQPFYQDRPGHPVTFHHSFLNQLTELQGDEGARKILKNCKKRRKLDLDDPGILQDVDTPEALAAGEQSTPPA